jgi:hypothetical protein
MRLLLFMFLLAGVLPLFAQDADVLRHFDYDHKASLDLREVGVEQRTVRINMSMENCSVCLTPGRLDL